MRMLSILAILILGLSSTIGNFSIADDADSRVVVVRLTRSAEVVGQNNNESAAMKADKTWKSAPNGWLSAQSGTWAQKAGGVELYDDEGKYFIRLVGLTWTTVGDDTVGRYFDGNSVDTGSWKIISSK